LILDFLKQQTREQHERVEGLMPVMHDALTPEGYVHVLLALLDVYVALEVRLARSPLPGAFDHRPGRWSGLIRRDLQALGVRTVPRGPAEGAVPFGEWEALGCLYVLEGAALGGQVIARHVRRRLRLAPEAGLAFFTGGGADAGRSWRAFRVAAAQHAAHAGDAEWASALRGAREAFAVFEERLARASRNVGAPA